MARSSSVVGIVLVSAGLAVEQVHADGPFNFYPFSSSSSSSSAQPQASSSSSSPSPSTSMAGQEESPPPPPPRVRNDHPRTTSAGFDPEALERGAKAIKEISSSPNGKKAGQTVHVGGLLRLDLNQASVETIYVTVFASASISLHLGKTENADETWRKQVGIRLQPPVSEDCVTNLEQLQKSEFKISGISWDVNSTDIAVAGLGWISLGLEDQANVTLYSYEGVEVTLREPLVLDRARFLERPGFLLPKAISEALGQQSKLEAQKKKKLEEEAEEMLV